MPEYLNRWKKFSANEITDTLNALRLNIHLPNVKALSIQQPWAWLIVNGYKDIENRSWKTNFRGPVLIHTGLKLDAEAVKDIRELFPDIPLPDSFERGGIVGICTVTDCVTTSKSPWFFGRHGFTFDKQIAFPNLMPCKGALGFFKPDFNSRYVTPPTPKKSNQLDLLKE